MEKVINIVYKMLIDGLEFTLNNLKIYGLTDENISLLLEKRIIRETVNDNYELVRPLKFRQYGIKLLKSGNIEEAYKCFEKCYKMIPNNRDICLQMIDIYIRMKKYDLAFEVYETLEKIKPKYTSDNDLILYLLSYVTKCPDKYTHKVKNFKYKDYKIPETRNFIKENKVRMYISNNNFTYAYNLMNDFVQKMNNYSVKFELIRILLYKTIDRTNQIKRDLLKFTKNKQYIKINDFLENIFKTRKLTTYEMRVLKITSSILKENDLAFLTNNNIDNDLMESNNPLDIALANNDFIKALEINKEFLQKNNINSEEDCINILLVELNRLNKNTFIEFTNDWYKNIKNYVDLILKEKTTLEIAIKKYNILNIETILLIKLEYIRRCFETQNETLIEEGKILLQEVEMCEIKTEKIKYLIDKIYSLKKNKEKKLKKGGFDE